MLGLVALVLLVAAFVCFLLAAVGVPTARVVVGWLGAALATMALILDNWPGK